MLGPYPFGYNLGNENDLIAMTVLSWLQSVVGPQSDSCKQARLLFPELFHEVSESGAPTKLREETSQIGGKSFDASFLSRRTIEIARGPSSGSITWEHKRPRGDVESETIARSDVRHFAFEGILKAGPCIGLMRIHLPHSYEGGAIDAATPRALIVFEYELQTKVSPDDAHRPNRRSLTVATWQMKNTPLEILVDELGSIIREHSTIGNDVTEENITDAGTAIHFAMQTEARSLAETVESLKNQGGDVDAGSLALSVNLLAQPSLSIHPKNLALCLVLGSERSISSSADPDQSSLTPEVRSELASILWDMSEPDKRETIWGLPIDERDSMLRSAVQSYLTNTSIRTQ